MGLNNLRSVTNYSRAVSAEASTFFEKCNKSQAAHRERGRRMTLFCPGPEHLSRIIFAGGMEGLNCRLLRFDAVEPNTLQTDVPAASSHREGNTQNSPCPTRAKPSIKSYVASSAEKSLAQQIVPFDGVLGVARFPISHYVAN